MGDPKATPPEETMAEQVKSRKDDRKTLGSGLIAIASTSMLAIGSAVLSLADKRVEREVIWIGLFIAIVLLVASIYCGGRGIAALNTPAASKPKWFNRQSVFLLWGYVLAIVTFGIWLTSPSKINSDVESLRKQLSEAKERLAASEANQRRNQQDIVVLRVEVDKLAQKIQSGKQSRHP